MLWERLPIWSKDGTTRWDNTKSSEHLAPSWSWAGVLGRQADFPNWPRRDGLSSKFAVNVARVVQVHTIHKGPDLFGQVISGEITLNARFYQLARHSTIIGEEEAAEIDLDTSPFLQHVYRAFRDSGRRAYEFVQQHVPTSDQKFAIIELIRWAKAPGSGVPGMELLALESTGKVDNVYRRVGLFTLRKENIPDPDAVGTDAYNRTVTQNKAWMEVVNLKWEKRKIIIVWNFQVWSRMRMPPHAEHS